MNSGRIDDDPAFLVYREQAKEAFAAAGLEWSAFAGAVVRCYRNGTSIDDLLGAFVLNRPV